MTKIRIKDIAEIANVSIGTVDRVLHNRGQVSPVTREKVQKLLEEHDYSPDIIASSLASKREVRLGVVMPSSVNDHAFWDLPAKGIEKALKELDHYDLSLQTYFFDPYVPSKFAHSIRKIQLETTDGFLFAPVFRKESLRFLEKCRESGIPVVLFNSFLENTAVRGFVGQDAFQSGYLAAKLIQYGVVQGRDLVIVNLSAGANYYAHLNDREQGFRSYFEEHSERLKNLVSMTLTDTSDRVLFGKLDEIFDKFDVAGIFVTNSRVYRVARFLAERGMMNVRLVGYDLLQESIDFLNRDYIDFLISQNPEEQAFRGLNSLFGLVAFQREPQPRHLLPIDIITRENLQYYIT